MLHDIDKSIKMTYLENIMIFKLIFNLWDMKIKSCESLKARHYKHWMKVLHRSFKWWITLAKRMGMFGVWDLWEIEIAEKHRSWWQKISENAHKLQKSSQSETLVCVIFVSLCPVRRGYYIATVPNIHDFFIFFSLDSVKRWTKGLYRRLIRHFRILFWI